MSYARLIRLTGGILTLGSPQLMSNSLDGRKPAFGRFGMSGSRTQPVLTKALLVLLVLGCQSGADGKAPEASDATHTVARSYHVVHGWPQVPRGELLGQVSGVGVYAHGDLLIFRRGSRSWLSGADSLSLEPIVEPTVLQFRGRPVS